MQIIYWDQSREIYSVDISELKPLYQYWEPICKKYNLKKILEWGIYQGIDVDYVVQLVDQLERLKSYVLHAPVSEIPPDIARNSLELIERLLLPLQEAKDHWDIICDLFF
jgi:hypothetical protein